MRIVRQSNGLHQYSMIKQLRSFTREGWISEECIFLNIGMKLLGEKIAQNNILENCKLCVNKKEDYLSHAIILLILGIPVI